MKKQEECPKPKGEILTRYNLLLSDNLGNWKNPEYKQSGISCAKIAFPTTKEYGGKFDSFDQILNWEWEYSYDKLCYGAESLLECGKEYLSFYFTKEMMNYIHNAIVSYAEHFPYNPIFQQVLDEFNWDREICSI